MGFKSPNCSCDELADATSGGDAFLSDLGELLSADDAWGAGELTLAEDLEVSLLHKKERLLLINRLRTYSLGNIDHSSLLLGGGLAGLFRHEGPKLVKVHRWAVVLVSLIVEMSLSLLTEVARMTAHKHHKRRVSDIC